MRYTRLFTLLLLVACVSGCDLDNPEDGIATSDIIVLSIDKDSILANGVDRAVLSATLGPLAEPDQEITFSTEQGTLSGSSAENPDLLTIKTSNKVAITTLQSNNVADDQVEVSAAVGDFKALQTLRFRRAYPDNMIFSAEKNTIDADRIDFATLTIQLFRDIGVPSLGTKINLEVIANDPGAADIKPFIFSGDDGSATVTVKSGNGQPGMVNIKASTRNQAGNTVSQILTLEFQ